MARSKKDQMMIYVLLALVPLGGAYYLYDNQYQEYLAWEAQIVELNTKIGAAQQAAAELERLHEEEIKLTAALDSALERLPREEDVTQILNTVETLMREAAINTRRIESKSIAEPVAMGIYNRHPIRLGGIKNLSPPAIADLFTRLQYFEKIFATQSFTLTRDPATGRYTLDLEIETYTTADEGAAAP